MRQRGTIDDADMAAGRTMMYQNQSAPNTASSMSSLATINTTESKNPNDLRFTDDATPMLKVNSAGGGALSAMDANNGNDPILVLGIDVSHLSRRGQFMTTASGVFWFSLLYGYLQELISVKLCHRQLGLFLAMVQFAGYTLLSYWLHNFVERKQKRMMRAKHSPRDLEAGEVSPSTVSTSSMDSVTSKHSKAPTVPWRTYFGLSLLRAVDLGMTNLAMQYINYPAKTLMKSSRIVFTMLFGVYFGKKYFVVDYMIVGAMVAGLALFMHADVNSDAVFDYRGVIMLTISLLCDGAISNMSEKIMSKYGVGQDEFIFRMYSIAFLAISAAAAVKGDLRQGMAWMMVPGTYDQMDLPADDPSREWTISAKWTVLVVFSSMGFFGSSCSAAITKNFGALTMSITSTARKATTLFLSFFLFQNVCTSEHILGIFIFITALTTKSLRRGRKKHKRRHAPKLRNSGAIPANRSVSQSYSATLPSDDNSSSNANNSHNHTSSNGTTSRLVRRTNSSDGIPLLRAGSANGTNMAKGIHVV